MKLRIGIILWALSWVPYGLIFGLEGRVAHAGVGVRDHARHRRLALAGTEFAQAVKAKGWKGAPKVAWRALRHGSDVEDVEVVP